jgi:hypothetical protein
MKALLRFSLSVALLVVVFLSTPRKAQADITCSDCIRLCFLNQCGFISDPACEAAVYDYCYNDYCADYC